MAVIKPGHKRREERAEETQGGAVDVLLPIIRPEIGAVLVVTGTMSGVQ